MTLLANIKKWESQETQELTQSYIDKGFKASGNWPRELEWVNTLTPFRLNLKLLGAAYTQFMIDGRGPTSPTGPYQDGPKLITLIEQWVKDKGLSLDPFAVTENIHKYGTKQFNNPDPKKKRLLTDALKPDSINKLIDVIRQQQIEQIQVNFQKTFK